MEGIGKIGKNINSVKTKSLIGMGRIGNKNRDYQSYHTILLFINWSITKEGIYIYLKVRNIEVVLHANVWKLMFDFCFSQ